MIGRLPVRAKNLVSRMRALAAPPEDGTPIQITALTARLYAVLVGGCALFLLWGAIFKLDVASTAMGEIIPASQIKSIQHLEGGIVEDILVHEGEKIRRDEPLVILQATQSTADVGELAVRVGNLQIDITRLEAEEKGAPRLIYPEAVEKSQRSLVERARSLFDSRRSRQSSLIAAKHEAITQRQQAVREISTRIANNGGNLRLLDEQVKISEDLLREDLTNRLQHLNLVREAGQLRSRIDEDRAALRRAESEIDTARADLANAQATYLEEVRTQLGEARRSLDEFAERSHKYADTLDRTVLRAPVDGVVKTVHVKTIGEVVKAGVTVVEMVPMGDAMIIEAKLPVQDVGWVELGSHASIRLASTDAALFSPINAKVVHISPDTLTTDEGASYYRVRLETEADHFSSGAIRYRLLPGVQVTASILLGRRSVLQYLLSPYFADLDQALRER